MFTAQLCGFLVVHHHEHWAYLLTNGPLRPCEDKNTNGGETVPKTAEHVPGDGNGLGVVRRHAGKSYPLACGHSFTTTIPPRFGDVLYCQRCQDYSPRRTKRTNGENGHE